VGRRCLELKIITMATAAVMILDSKKRTIALADIVDTVGNDGKMS
jgi:hypothetical protein